MDSEFKREHGRYFVIKDKDLTPGQRFALHHTLHNQGIPTRECVVIENDWPIYEAAWEMVRRMAEGLIQEVDELRSNAEEMKRLKIELCNALGYDAPNPSMCDLIVEAQLLTRERDAYRNAEEAQIALRENAQEERDALASHIDRLFGVWSSVVERSPHYSPRNLENVMCAAFSDAPTTSLARRDAAQRGKALAETAKWFAALHTSTELLSAEVVYDILMDQSRRQTEAQQ